MKEGKVAAARSREEAARALKEQERVARVLERAGLDGQQPITVWREGTQVHTSRRCSAVRLWSRASSLTLSQLVLAETCRCREDGPSSSVLSVAAFALRLDSIEGSVAMLAIPTEDLRTKWRNHLGYLENSENFLLLVEDPAKRELLRNHVDRVRATLASRLRS